MLQTIYLDILSHLNMKRKIKRVATIYEKRKDNMRKYKCTSKELKALPMIDLFEYLKG